MLRIEVWEQEPGSNTRWRVRCTASPGNVEALLSDISLGEGEPEDDATSGMAVIFAVVANAAGGVGVAYANTAFRNLGLVEFRDTEELKDLEGVVVQIGGRECILDSDGPRRAGIENVMTRCEVLCTPKPPSTFKGAKDAAIKDLAELVRADYVGDNRNVSRGVGESNGESSATSHVAGARAMPLALTALLGLVRHLELEEDSAKHHTFSLTMDELRKYMHYDAAASKAMGVFPSPNRFQLASALGHGDDGGKTADFSLFSILNKTCTAMGSRRLKGWLQHPLVDVDEITRRQAMVQTLCTEKALMDTLQRGSGMLRGMPDLERISQRFLGKPVKVSLATLLGVYRAVMRLTAVTDALDKTIADGNGKARADGDEPPGAQVSKEEDGRQLIRQNVIVPLREAVSNLSQFMSLCEEVIDLEHLEQTRQVRVRPSFHEELNRLGHELDRAREDMFGVLRDVERESKAASGKIKLECNAVHSNHLRVTKKDQALVGKCKAALTLSVQKAGVLFTTDKLRATDARATRLKAQYEDVQSKIVEQAVVVAATYAPVLSSVAQVLSELDVLLAFATCVHVWDWCRPRLLPVGSQVVDIKDLRHPSVEASRGSSVFIPNDVNMENDSRLAIVTGPNMAGKSTFIRSVGIACLLAQIGCFVPAAEATITVVDRICARVGASDNQLLGVSTFMAEMLETVAILRRAGRGSLVIVDELGRGTSTCDGFGIAWAVAQRLASSGCLCLFATHFHELTALEKNDDGNGVQNLHVTAEADVKSNKLTMLYKVAPGSCDRSFGIHVARLANFPAHVVADAESIAVALESGQPLQAHFAKSGERDSDAALEPSASPQSLQQEPVRPVGESNGKHTCVSTGSDRGKRKVPDDSRQEARASSSPPEKRSR